MMWSAQPTGNLELLLLFFPIAAMSQCQLKASQLEFDHRVLCSAMDRYLLVVQSASSLVGEAKSCL